MHEGVNPILAANRAVAALYAQVQQQASMLSYIDVFKVLGVAAFCMIGLVVFLKTINLKGAQAGH
jgi:hypothetical protein